MIFILSCARTPVKSDREAMRPLSFNKEIEASRAEGQIALGDDASYETLKAGLDMQVKYWEGKGASQEVHFGPRSLTAGEYLQALRELRDRSSSKESFFDHLRENFDFYEVYGGEHWGEVMVTGYYEPVIKGSLKPTKEFSQALYSTPKDMVSIDMGAFAKTFPHWSPFETWVSEQKSRPV
jgi:membrane-bound lytic murein transglycosylase A